MSDQKGAEGFLGLLKLYYPHASKAELNRMMSWTVAKAKGSEKKANEGFSEAQHKEIAALFASYDKDGKGSITMKDLQEGLKDSGMNYDEIEEMFMEIDEDGSGELELDEFVQLVEECKLFETFESMQEQIQKGRQESSFRTRNAGQSLRGEKKGRPSLADPHRNAATLMDPHLRELLDGGAI